MWSTLYCGLHVKYPLLRPSCEVPFIAAFVWSTLYCGLRVLYPLLWPSCEVPFIVAFVWSTLYCGLRVMYPLLWPSCKYLLILSDFKRNFDLLETSEKFSVSAFTKIHPEGAEFLTCGRTDRHDEANSRFSQFCRRTYNNTLFRKLDLFPSSVEGGGGGILSGTR